MNPAIIIAPALFLTIAWIVHVVVDGIRRRQQLRVTSEFHAKLLDRIGSAQEFGEFLGSEAGARFLDSLTTEKAVPHTRILRALQSGIVLLVLGVALFIYTGNVDLPGRSDEGVAFFATVCSAVGFGLLASTMLSYRLSRRMGLINGDRGHSHLRDVTSPS